MNIGVNVLKEYIETELSQIEYYFLNLAKNNDDFLKVYDAELENLPTMMDTGSDLFNKLVCEKLKDEDSISSPKYTHQAIWNLELDVECMESIAFQDGKSCALRGIAKKMRWKDLAKRATYCIYKD